VGSCRAFDARLSTVCSPSLAQPRTWLELDEPGKSEKADDEHIQYVVTKRNYE